MKKINGNGSKCDPRSFRFDLEDDAILTEMETLTLQGRSFFVQLGVRLITKEYRRSGKLLLALLNPTEEQAAAFLKSIQAAVESLNYPGIPPARRVAKARPRRGKGGSSGQKSPRSRGVPGRQSQRSESAKRHHQPIQVQPSGS